MSGGTIVLFILAAVSWLLLLAFINGYAGEEAHGDAAVGVALSFFAAVFFICLTWLWLGLLLLKAAGQGLTPPWAGTTAAILVPASAAAAAVAALYLTGGSAPQWPVAVPIAVPVLIAGYAGCLYQSGARAFVTGTPAGLTIWGTILVLTLAPLSPLAARYSDDLSSRAASQRAQAVWDAQDRERRHDEYLTKLQAMTADQPLPEWYPLLNPQNGVRAEALEALRHVERRQADVEMGLNCGIPAVFALVPELDLKVTPELCEAGDGFLQKDAQRSRRGPQSDAAPYVLTADATARLDVIRWLATHGCDWGGGIEALRAAAGTWTDSPDRRKYFVLLDELKRESGAKAQP
jgi:hypothetical protein